VPELLFNPGDIGKLSCGYHVLVVHHLLDAVKRLLLKSAHRCVCVCWLKAGVYLRFVLLTAFSPSLYIC
jgi:hypothetical protein